MWARYDFAGSHGTFNYTQSFEDPSPVHSDSATQARSDLTYATTGDQMTVGALAQMKIGPIAVRAQVERGAVAARPARQRPTNAPMSSHATKRVR